MSILEQQYQLIQRAQKMETINEELSLKLYLEAFALAKPKITQVYDSTIRLLEKRGRYEEAVRIIRMAKEQIEEGEMTSSAERFDPALERILKKIAPSENDEKAKGKKGYRNLLIVSGIFASALLLFLVVMLIRPYPKVDVNLDGKKGLHGGEQIFSEEEKKYPITSKMMEWTKKNMERELAVREAHVAANGKVIVFSLLLDGSQEETAKDMAAKFVSYMAAAASAEYKELQPATSDSLGEIYEHYSFLIEMKSDPQTVFMTAQKEGREIVYTAVSPEEE